VTSTDTKTTAFGEINTRWRVAAAVYAFAVSIGLGETTFDDGIVPHVKRLSWYSKKLLG
jgi:hypothetical protein